MAKVEIEPDAISTTRVILRSDSDTVELRQLIIEDAEVVYELLDSSREHIGAFMPSFVEGIQSVENVRLRIIRALDDKSEMYSFGIWDGDVIVGCENIYLCDGIVGETESWVGKRFTGHHYAARGRALLLEFAFDQLGLKGVESNLNIDNVASKKSVERSGYTLIETNSLDGTYTYIFLNPK